MGGHRPPSRNRGLVLGGPPPSAVQQCVQVERHGSRSSSLRSKRAVAHGEAKGVALGDVEVLEALRRAFQTPMEAFRAFDRNLDGIIDRAEFEMGLTAVSAPRVP